VIFLTVLIDNRETQEVQRLGIKKFGSGNAIVTTLVTGDVLVDGMIFERKTVEDLISSVTGKEKRLHHQAPKMMVYEDRFLIIEGSFNKVRKRNSRYRQYDQKWYRGVIASMIMKYGLNVIEVENNREFWIQIERLVFKKKEKGIFERSQVYTPKVTMEHNKRVDLSMLCCIPGVSETIGLNILDKFSLYQLYDVSKEDLQTIDKVGPVIAAKIKSEFKEDP
jgi:ERCC4-type nuclease